VGRYGVTHDDLERLAIPALRAHADVVVVDELGKMELTTAAFRDAVIALLDRPTALVATVHVRPDPFTDDVAKRRQTGMTGAGPFGWARQVAARPLWPRCGTSWRGASKSAPSVPGTSHPSRVAPAEPMRGSQALQLRNPCGHRA
jgi:NTPase